MKPQTIFNVVVGLALAFGAYLIVGALGQPAAPAPGAATTTTINSASAYEALVKWFGNGFYAGLNQEFAVSNAGLMTRGGNAQGIQSKPVVGGLFDGAYVGSSTPFAFANPFAATSTCTLEDIGGSGQATSTAILVGTSSRSTGILGTTMTVAAFASSTIATSSAWMITPGLYGATAAGGGAQRSIQVGPSEFIVGFSTSTYGGAGALNYVNGLGSNATYKFMCSQ